MIKKILFRIAVGLSVPVVLVAAFSQLPVDRHRGRIESKLSLVLGRRVRIQKVELKLWPPSFIFRKVAVGESPLFPKSGPFILADEVSLPVDISTVFTGKVQLKTITLVHPRISVVRNKEGRWNFTVFDPEPAGQTKDQNYAGFTGINFDNAVVILQEEGNKEPKFRYDRLDVKVDGFAPGKPFQVTASLHLPGKRAESVMLSAQVGPLQMEHLALTPVDAHLDMQHVWAGNLARFLVDPEAASVYGGSIFGTVELKIKKGELATSGTVTVHGFEMGGDHLLFPATAIFRVGGNVDTGLYRLDSLDLALERQHCEITGTLHTGKVPAEVDLSVQLPSGSVAPVASLLDVLGDSMGIESSGALSGALKVTGTLEKPRFSGTVTMLGAAFKPRTMTSPIQVENAKILFDGDQISAPGIVFKVGSAKIRGDVSIKQLEKPELNFKLLGDIVSLGEWGAMRNAAVQPKKNNNGWFSRMTGGGTLSLGTLMVGGVNVSAVESKISIGKDPVIVTEFRGSLYGGDVSGTLKADLRNPKPQYEAALVLQRLDCNNFLTSFTAVQDMLVGTLGGKAAVRFEVPADGSLIRTLNGTASFVVQDGGFRRYDFPGALQQLAKAPAGNGSAKETLFKSLSGNLNVEKGEAAISGLRGEMPAGVIEGGGSVNLEKQMLNLQVTGELKAANRGAAGAGDPFVLKQGKVLVPVKLTGTVAEPVMSSDAATLGKLRQ